MNIQTLPETARHLGVNETTLRSAAIDKRIPASKSGRAWLFDLDDPKVKVFAQELTPRRPRRQAKPTCEVCGQPVPRARARFCSQKCYGQSTRKES